MVPVAFLLFTSFVPAASVKFARLRYNGGGDWYANPTALPNLITFCNKELGTDINRLEETVEASSQAIFNYPFVHMTGHGNVVFSPADIQNLRNYLMAGGFLHIDDNYGMDKFVRPEIRKIFPEYELVEIPYSHPIYRQKYTFANGLPKIHEHSGKPAQGFGIVHEGRVVLFYTFESDLSDGWEDQQVHNDPPDVRRKALQMGANMVQYAFTVN